MPAAEECLYQRWHLGVQQPLRVFLSLMYSSNFNPISPFRSRTSCGNGIHNLDTCCVKNTLVLASLLNLTLRTCMFYPKFLCWKQDWTAAHKQFFQICSGLHRGLYHVPPLAIFPVWRASTCCLNKSGATSLVWLVVFLCDSSSASGREKPDPGTPWIYIYYDMMNNIIMWNIIKL